MVGTLVCCWLEPQLDDGHPDNSWSPGAPDTIRKSFSGAVVSVCENVDVVTQHGRSSGREYLRIEWSRIPLMPSQLRFKLIRG